MRVETYQFLQQNLTFCKLTVPLGSLGHFSPQVIPLFPRLRGEKAGVRGEEPITPHPDPLP